MKKLQGDAKKYFGAGRNKSGRVFETVVGSSDTAQEEKR